MEHTRICVVTGSRAEYGLLYWVLRDLRDDPAFELQLVVTGAHLAPEFGLTVNDIVADGFAIARRVEMLLSSDSAGGVAKSLGLGVIGMSDALAELVPDVVLILGDRYEMLAVAQACLMHGVPLAHIAGGDTSEGAFDESIRHAITKLAHVHFVTNDESARRVRQLGEDPAHVHVVGSPGLDHLRRRPLLDRAALEQALGARLAARNLLVTFHPVTLEATSGVDQFGELLSALDTLADDTAIFFTRPNADPGGRTIAAQLDAWAAERSGRVHSYTSLGQLRYLSLMAQADAVVGNSSSGLYEAPSLQVPTVDIGERQRGRLAAASVLHCEPERMVIAATIRRAFELDCSAVVNPYGDGRSAERIVGALRQLPARDALLRKAFHWVEASHG
jgi:UDP-N-acetylglucosamine 2-epimerase (non-hydrolysing)/GDP/UDP-N,N'-diacetylbacillosamine 2-epimerase (hydrolysing)